MTFTGAIGTICNVPLRGLIRACAALRIHPNYLTLTGVLVNVVAAYALGLDSFKTAGVLMIVANIFDYIDGKVARELNAETPFGGFWDSVMDIICALAMMFSVMTSYTRARAESIIPKCKVGFMERPERIVLFMIGAFTNRMAGVLWVILVLSIVTVAARIYYTWRESEHRRRPELDLAARLQGGAK
jgi:CDP-diacylglycerol--glycerol-3-phosphate 3-phosphatidyltransferase